MWLVTFTATETPGVAVPATVGAPGCADADEEDEDAMAADDDDDDADAALPPAPAPAPARAPWAAALLSLAAAGTTGLGMSDIGLIVADPSSLARFR